MGQAIQLDVTVQGQGFPILCLHGHPGSGQSLSVFTDVLSSQFQTIAPDLRGYGRSKTSQAFTMTDHLLDLTALLDRLRIQHCLLLGWSLGGILALELALRHPARISGLILVATAAYPRGNHPPITWQDNVYTGVASILNRLCPGWQWNIDTFGRRSLYRYLIQRHTAEAYRYLARDAVPAYLQTSAAATQALQTALKNGYDRRSDLSRIIQPCLMLAAAGDRHITAASSYETAEYLTDCTYRQYSNAAHLFPWEIPNQVVADIKGWLDQHPNMTQVAQKT